MKRYGNLYEQIISMENLEMAETIARKGKSGQHGVQVFDQNRDENLQALQVMLRNKTFRTSQYTTFKVYEPKEREVYRLPYYPDRIVHHAIMNVLEPIFVASFTRDTYSCIKGRGIHGAFKQVQKSLRHEAATEYCLKLDITKFYPSVDHDILKAMLRRKFKDPDLLWILDEIIDSAPGLPIGNYLSQYLANFYLTYFDHWLKEVMKVRYYFRYADDLVILSDNKYELHQLRKAIEVYLWDNLKLKVKKNWQVFPVDARSLDFVGYCFYHHKILLRKSIKQRFARKMARSRNWQSFASYYGWASHANCINLIKTLTDEKVRRPGYHPRPKRVRWRQKKRGLASEQNDHSP